MDLLKCTYKAFVIPDWTIGNSFIIENGEVNEYEIIFGMNHTRTKES